MQIVSHNEVPAAVHRVVAGPAPRLSAPILLRGRPSMKLDVGRYLGEASESGLLKECDGMSMDEIHSAIQPSSCCEEDTSTRMVVVSPYTTVVY